MNDLVVAGDIFFLYSCPFLLQLSYLSNFFFNFKIQNSYLRGETHIPCVRCKKSIDPLFNKNLVPLMLLQAVIMFQRLRKNACSWQGKNLSGEGSEGAALTDEDQEDLLIPSCDVFHIFLSRFGRT